MIGQVMQCPPPRPRPNSEPTMVMTSTPALRSRELVVVLVVGEHDARRRGDDVVAAVPLLAFVGVHVPTGGQHPQDGQVECVGDDRGEGVLLLDDLDRLGVAGPQGEGVDAVDDVEMGGGHVAVGEGEHTAAAHDERVRCGGRLTSSGEDETSCSVGMV
jgi:hypothetical protein